MMKLREITSAFANRVDQLSELLGKMTWYLTLAMVMAGAYNALVRSLSGWAHLDPSDGEILQKTLYWIGEIARQGSSNTFIELQWYLFSVVFLIGGAYALKADAHVRVDILYNRLSVKGKAWINIVGTIIFLLPFCALMLWTSWPVVVDSWVRLEGSADPGGLPRYPLLTMVPLAFILLMVQGLATAAREVLQLLSSKDART